MQLKYYFNALENDMLLSPNEKWREQQQALYNAQWENTSARIVVKEQAGIGLDIFGDIEVWINKAIGTTSTFMKNGEDYRQLVFKDIDKPCLRGIYYQFEYNWCITDFVNPSQGLVSDIVVRRCNNVLRMIDPDNGSIFTIPCVIDYDMTSPNVQVSSHIITPNNHAIVFVQANEDTMRLFKLNTRFLLGGRPFKLNAFQNALLQETLNSAPTVLYFDLYLDELHAKDNKEQQIAYNGDFVYNIMIDSNNLELANGTTGILSANVLLNGEEVNRVIQWSSSDCGIVNINQNGEYSVVGQNRDVATITAALDGNDNVRAQITITVADASTIQPLMVFSPVFDKIRQYQTITMDITVSYGNEIIIPQIVQADSPSSILELSLNDNKLIYQVGKDYEFKSYIYDITTKETREYESSSGGEIFLDDKIYLVKSNNDYTNSGDSIISVDSNNKEETLYGPVSYYLTLQYLGNNTFHFSEIRGQDITAEIIYYNLDIESSEVKEMDYGYSIIKVINDNDLTEPEEINNSKETDITLDDLVGEYEGTRTSDSNYSIGEIFGTSLRYGNSLIINDDNTYSLNVGVAYSEDGKYEIDGNKLKLYDIDNKSDNSRPTEDELLIDVIDDKVTLKHREDIDDNNYVYVIFEK